MTQSASRRPSPANSIWPRAGNASAGPRRRHGCPHGGVLLSLGQEPPPAAQSPRGRSGGASGGEADPPPPGDAIPSGKPVRSCQELSHRMEGLRQCGRLKAGGGDGIGPRGERGSRPWTFGIRRESTRMPGRLAPGWTPHPTEAVCMGPIAQRRSGHLLRRVPKHESQCCRPRNAAICKDVSSAKRHQPAWSASGRRFCGLLGPLARLNPILGVKAASSRRISQVQAF